MRRGLYWRFPFIQVGIVVWIFALLPTVIGMTHSFREIANGAQPAQWMTAQVLIWTGVTTLAAALLVSVGLLRGILGWLRLRNAK